MNPPFLRRVHSLIFPHGFLFGAAAILLTRDRLPDAFLPFLSVFPYAVLGLALFLGWRFNRSRLIYAALLLTMAERCLVSFASGDTGHFVFAAVAVTLPLNLAAVSSFKERGMANLVGSLRVALVFGQFLALAWIHANHYREGIGYLEYSLVKAPILERLHLPQPALAAFALSLLFLAVRFLRRPAALEGSFLWALLTVAFALASGAGGQSLTLYLAFAGLILVVGIIELSHFMAYRDELTELPGRRALNEALDKLAGRYTVAMLDIDHFKKFNDTHGHDTGDQVLRMVASRLAAVTGGGYAFRYGGEEFSVIFPRKQMEDTLPHLEKLRQAVEESRFILRGEDRPKKKPSKPASAQGNTVALSVTISIGAAEKNGQQATPDMVMKAADEALYRAKKGGRNRVCT